MEAKTENEETSKAGSKWTIEEDNKLLEEVNDNKPNETKIDNNKILEYLIID